mgnify:CR=1 FL=1
MQTVTIPAKTYEKILSKLERLSQEVESIKIRLSKKEPAYGSNEWWNWSDRKAQEDIKAGRVMRFDSAEEAIRWLNS